MEQPQYLLDTNAIIDFLGDKFSPAARDFMAGIIDNVPNLSVITKIEVLGYNAPEKESVLLNDFMNDAMVLDLGADIVSITIDIRKRYKIKLPDAIIAATAMSRSFTLISRNFDDFKIISDLKLVNAHTILL